MNITLTSSWDEILQFAHDEGFVVSEQSRGNGAFTIRNMRIGEDVTGTRSTVRVFFVGYSQAKSRYH